MRYLVFDISNMLYRTFFVHTQEDDETLAGLATHTALMTLNKYFRQFKPDRVVIAFDRHSWRKEYTASALCVSKRPYKGDRRKNMTPAQQKKYAQFVDHLNDFENLIREHTTIVSMFGEGLEADDLIAGFVERWIKPTDEVVIISSDTDLLQLLKYPQVKIYTPDKGKQQDLKEFNNDPELYLFTKCIRGDSTDNIQSAFPNVKTTRIKKAYEDSFERVKLMKETWVGADEQKFRVEELYKENKLLIDLSAQPEPIKEMIDESIKEALERKHKFSMFHILRYLGKYNLKKIADSIEQYVPLLSR